MQGPDFTGAMQFGSADTDSQAVHFNPGGSGLLEMQPHNLIHGFVGGVMSQFFSPQDPVFWLHPGCRGGRIAARRVRCAAASRRTCCARSSTARR